MLVLSRRSRDAIMIGNDIKITVLSISGDHVRLGIEAPADVAVHREEVYLDLRQANQEAVRTSAEALAGLAAVLPEATPAPGAASQGAAGLSQPSVEGPGDPGKGTAVP